MESDNAEAIERRLKSIEGHVRGVRRMVDEGAYCIDVVNQIVAIERALKKVGALVLDDHLHSCVADAMGSSDENERERVVQELLQVYEAVGRG